MNTIEFRIGPKPMIGTKVFVRIIDTSLDGITIYWELKTEADKIIDKGNWTLPKAAFSLFAQLEINKGEHIKGDAVRAAINSILADPAIEMELADYVEDAPEPTGEPQEETPTV